jgi:hypothetical protein
VQNSGALNVANTLVNHGTLRLTGAAALTVGDGGIVNHGVLDVMTWSGALPPIENHGLLLDSSQVKIDSAKMSGSDFLLTIHGYVGHQYQFQSSEDLTPGSWQNIGAPVAGADAPIEFIHSGGAPAERRFYRVSVSP